MSTSYKLSLKLNREYSRMKKRPFFIVHNPDPEKGSVTGFLIYAYSRKQVDEIFDQPETKWITNYENDFENIDYFRIFIKSLEKAPKSLVMDVDEPSELLQHFLDQNDVSLGGRGRTE